MASNTENLNLLMKNPSTDGADTFNVQTMLNENWQKIDNNAGTVAQTLANILKPTTPPIIGLPPSTTPDGMFQALGNTGELHVWRKTVKNSEDVPAGYTLGDVQTGNFKFVADSYRTFEFGTPSVDDAGNVGLNVEGSVNGRYNSNFNDLKGKFCRPPDSTWYIDASLGSQVIYIPADATFSQSGSYKYVDKYQIVTGYPLTPARTTTTYPVSTNPNAYQEGDDAKAAGYVLGEVVTGQFKMSERYPTNGYYYKYASSISVADDGTISLNNPSQISFDVYNGGQSYANNCLVEIAGKFVYLANRNSGTSAPDSKPPFNSVPSGVVYIPSDATLTWTEEGTLDGFTLSKYQPVTGYPAIPARTTIEYLGKLGDKARVQVVSYVGTGTYGSSNPNSLTFDFVAKFIMELGSSSGKEGIYFSSEGGVATIPNFLDNDYRSRCGFGDLAYSYCKKSVDGKTITWYSTGDQYKQENSAGVTYYYVAIG